MNIKEVFKNMNEYFSPKIIATVNDTYVKLAKFKGEFPEHIHENEDEMFFVLKGEFELLCGKKIYNLKEGDSFVVKKGQSHMPKSKEESWIMLIESKNTKHSGDIATNLSKTIEEQML